jgi:valyl-tRNA synthetase
MITVFDTCLRLLHPFTPYVTEELWGHLKRACRAHPADFEPDGGWEEALIVARWPTAPQALAEDEEASRDFALVVEVVRAIRNARAEKGVAPSRRIEAFIAAGRHTALFESQRGWLSSLARLDPGRLSIQETVSPPPENAVPLVVGTVEAFLPLAGMVDREAERARLTQDLKETQAQIDRLVGLLDGPFAERAPAEVVQKERDRLAALRETAAKLGQQVEALES